MAIVLLWVLYLGASAAVLLALRSLRRRLPATLALLFLGLPILFCAPGFFAARTMLPVDHIRMIPPWSVLGAGPHNPNLNDVVMQLAPWNEAVRLAWREGSLPLRNRWNGCGSPLAANGQSGAFSPLTLLMAALPLAHAFTFAASWKLFLALTGTWLWLRESGVGAAGALLGAVSFGFCLSLTPLLLFPVTGIFALWPWALFAIELGLGAEEPGARARAFAALCLVFVGWILLGHPESAVLGGVWIGLFLLARRFLGDRRASGALARMLAAALLAAAATAFVWVPEARALAASNRRARAEEFRAAMPVTLAPHPPAWRYGVLTSITPRILGDDVTSPRIAGAVGSFPDMVHGYFGLVGWSLALLVLRPGGRRHRASLALLVLLLLGLAVGTATWPIFDLALSVPWLALILPLRFLSWTAMAGAGLAAFELDRLLRDREAKVKSRLWAVASPVILASIAAAAFLAFRQLHAAAGGLSSQRHALAIAILTLAGAAVLLWTVSRGGAASRAAPLLLSGLAVCELFVQGARLYHWGRAEEVFEPTPLTAFLRGQTGSFRVVGEGVALFPGTNVFAGVEDVRTHDPAERLDYVNFLDVTAGYDPKPYFKMLANVDAPALDFLNVRFLVTANPSRTDDSRWRSVYSGPDGIVLENSRVLPRVFAPARIHVVASGPLSLPADWAQEASISGYSEATPGRTGTLSNVSMEILDYREWTNRIRFRTHPTDPASRAVLATSLVQDGGWTAQDEKGRKIPTVGVNGPFLGLVAGPGAQEVRLEYAPPGFRDGVVISAAALAAIGAMIALRLRAARKSRTDPGRPLAPTTGAQGGFTLVAVVIGIAILMILIAAIGPSIGAIMKRDREDELIFRGRQYARAIIIFQRRYGRLPNQLKELYKNQPRSIRKLWKDPMCNCDFHPLIQGMPDAVPGGVVAPPATTPGAQPTPTPVPTPGPFGSDSNQPIGPIVGVRSTVHKEAMKPWRTFKYYDQWSFIMGDADRDLNQVSGPLPGGFPGNPNVTPHQ